MVRHLLLGPVQSCPPSMCRRITADTLSSPRTSPVLSPLCVQEVSRCLQSSPRTRPVLSPLSVQEEFTAPHVCTRKHHEAGERHLHLRQRPGPERCGCPEESQLLHCRALSSTVSATHGLLCHRRACEDIACTVPPLTSTPQTVSLNKQKTNHSLEC